MKADGRKRIVNLVREPRRHAAEQGVTLRLFPALALLGKLRARCQISAGQLSDLIGSLRAGKRPFGIMLDRRKTPREHPQRTNDPARDRPGQGHGEKPECAQDQRRLPPREKGERRLRRSHQNQAQVSFHRRGDHFEFAAKPNDPVIWPNRRQSSSKRAKFSLRNRRDFAAVAHQKCPHIQQAAKISHHLFRLGKVRGPHEIGIRPGERREDGLRFAARRRLKPSGQRQRAGDNKEQKRPRDPEPKRGALEKKIQLEIEDTK